MEYGASLSCDITRSDLVLGTLYSLFGLMALYQFHSLLAQEEESGSNSQVEERKLQRIFLFFLVILCFARAINFFIQQFYFPGCERDIVMGGPWWLDMLGTLPAAFYFSAFTILIYKFAIIYHTILKVGYHNHELFFNVLRISLIFSNLSIYIILIITYTYQALASGNDSTDNRNSFGQAIEKATIYLLASVSLFLVCFCLLEFFTAGFCFCNLRISYLLRILANF